MVIFDDLQKLLLYQRLNLGFECGNCKRKFYNRLEHLQHSTNCKKERLRCSKCGKTFGHQQILQLHMQFHSLSESSTQNSPPVPMSSSEVCSDNVEVTVSSHGSEDTSTLSKNEDLPSRTTIGHLGSQLSNNILETSQSNGKSEVDISLPPMKIFEFPVPKKQSSLAIKRKPKSVKKRIGLTKVRMEDCLRCDDCSCIYIDEKDYYKHMRNFHQVDVNNTPIPQPKTKRKCRSCCKQCRGSHCTPVKRPRATQPASNLIFKINMRDNIKDRWSRMVSQQLSECTTSELPFMPSEEQVVIKPDPDAVIIKTEPDLSHLLSQVEVKIKTEPCDDFFM